MDELKSYLTGVLKTFDEDPADSEFQEGYYAAFEDILEAIEEMETDTNG